MAAGVDIGGGSSGCWSAVTCVLSVGVSFTSPRTVKTWPEVICSETFHLWGSGKKRNYLKLLVTELSFFSVVLFQLDSFLGHSCCVESMYTCHFTFHGIDIAAL